MSGLFSTFNIAVRGMSVQQTAIDVTAHNISNEATPGYSRQKAVIETSRPFGMPSLNNEMGPGQIGTGSVVTTIERVRDTFLDYQVRGEKSTLGKFQARDGSLSQVEKVFNEPSDTGMSSLIGKFYDTWQLLAGNPESYIARTVVAQQSATLANALNHNATQLEMVKVNTKAQIGTAVYDVNSMLDQVDHLNQQIIGVQVSGNQPNDLMDKRDLILDNLSSKFNINIDKKNFSGNDVSPIVDPANSAPNNANLVQAVNNSDVKRFSYISSIEPTDPIPTDKTIPYNCTVTYYKNGDMSNKKNEVKITVNGTAAQFKKLDENRVLWANKGGDAIVSDGTTTTPPGETTATIGAVKFKNLKIFEPISGEIRGYISVQEDTDNYIGQMDKLATALALSVNIIHSSGVAAADDKMPFFVNSTSGNSEQGITAGNISVNKEIISNPMNIKVQKEATSGAGDGSRALAIAGLRDSLIKIQDIGPTTTRTDFLKNNLSSGDFLKLENNKDGMKFDNFFKNIVADLGIQEQTAQSMVTNQKSVLASIQKSRDSVSGVSRDEEVANLVQYQHAYQANAKIISTIDQLLDVVINGLRK